METLVWSAHVIIAIVLIVLVLMQQGKGADMGAAFGGGSAGSLFGASGSGNFMSRATSIIAAIFFSTSLGLTYISSNRTEDMGIMSTMGEIVESSETSAVEETESLLEELEEDYDVQSLEIPEVDDPSRAGQIPD